MKNLAEDFADRVVSTLNEKSSELILSEEVFSVMPIVQRDLRLFVGHEKERDALVRGVSACLQGVYKKIGVYGESGVGKTSLVNLAIAAGETKSKKYLSIKFDKNDYAKGVDFVYLYIVSVLCSEIREVLRSRAREDEASKLIDNCSDCIKKIFVEEIKSIDDVINFAKKNSMGITDTQTAGTQNQNSKDEFLLYLHKQLGGQNVMVVIDDCHKLLVQGTLLQEVLQFTQREKWFYVMVFPTEILLQLKSQNDELTKDMYLVEVSPLSIQNCEELLRRRILYSQLDKRRMINNEPDYSKDLLPFTEKAVEVLATSCGGHPLKFINLLKKAWLKATDENAIVIDEILVLKLLEPVSKISGREMVLTKKQQEVFELLKERKEITIGQLAEYRGSSPAAAYFTLRDLVNLGLLAKRREGGKVWYVYSPKILE